MLRSDICPIRNIPWQTSCSATSAPPAPTGCGIGGAACGSTCEETTRTPSRRRAAGRLPGPPRRILDGGNEDTDGSEEGGGGGDRGRLAEEQGVMSKLEMEEMNKT